MNDGPVNNNFAKIDGFWKTPDISSKSDGKSDITNVFDAVFLEALTHLASENGFIPPAVFLPLTTLFDGASGTVTKVTDIGKHSLAIDFGMEGGLHFDSCGMPLVFILSPGKSYTPGMLAYYTATTSLTYRIICTGQGTAAAYSFYITVNGELGDLGLALST